MILGLPIAIWLGILTIMSLFTTISLGISVHVFHRRVFRFHMLFALLTGTLALFHLIFAVLLWFFGIII